MAPVFKIGGHVEVRDGVWKKLYSMVKDLDKKYVKVGIMSDRGGQEVEEGSNLTMLELGMIHQFGSEKANIPARYWLTTYFESKPDEVSAKVSELARAVVMNKVDVRRGLELLGLWATAQVKKTITTGEHLPPPLSPVTIARKGSDRPLVDTGRFVNSITHEVVE
jgi:hypothetical protein